MTFTHQVLLSAATSVTNGAPLDGRGRVYYTVQITGTWVGTITFEGTVEGNTWVAIPFTNPAGTSATTATTSDIYRISNPTSLLGLRARVSTYTSGSVSASVVCSNV